MPPDVGENYDPPVRQASSLAVTLRTLHADAGRPSTRTIARETGALSHTTVAELLRGRLVPTWAKVRSVARYLGADDADERRLLALWNAAVDTASAQCEGDQVEDQREAVTEATGSEWSNAAPAFTHAADPVEPPRGTVLAYQVAGAGEGVLLDYVTLRAGDGYWYTTGKLAIQGVTWSRVLRHIRVNSVGPVRYVTGWAELTLARNARVDEDD